MTEAWAGAMTAMFRRLRCQVFGHRWEAEEIDYGNGFGDVYVGDICRWCWKVVGVSHDAKGEDG